MVTIHVQTLLSLTSPAIAERLQWKLLQEIYSSDHLPIHIHFVPRQINIIQKINTRWNLKNPNWTLYIELLDKENTSLHIKSCSNTE